MWEQGTFIGVFVAVVSSVVLSIIIDSTVPGSNLLHSVLRGLSVGVAVLLGKVVNYYLKKRKLK